MSNGIVTYSTLGKNGRFANAAFQLAFTIAYALDHNKDFVFPEWWYSKWMQKPLPIGTVEDAIQVAVPFHYAPIQDYPGKNVDFRYSHGQSHKYFAHHWDVIKPYVTLRDEYKAMVLNRYHHLIHDTKTCSIHIRLGDYDNPLNRAYHGVMPLTYYEEAIKAIYGCKRPSDVIFFIFSDEYEKAKKLFSLPNMIFVEGNDSVIPKATDNSGLPIGNGDLLDLFLMSKCDHNIIANSSFSWMGAWMNENPNKMVVAPKNWFAGKDAPQITKDIYCDDWIVI